MRLKNRSRRMISFTLAHDIVCADGGACLCKTVEHRSRSHNVRTGDVGIRVVEKLIAASVHVAPGEVVEMRESAKKLPGVSVLLRSGRLRAQQ